MNPEEIIRQTLDTKHVMQLATSATGRPWVCSVYFVADENYNLYWASWPSRRHSQDISNNHYVAATVVIASAKASPVAGIQLGGIASALVVPEDIAKAASLYAAKFGRSLKWVHDIAQNNTQHRMYKLEVSKFVLFDEVHFSKNSRFELSHL